MGLRSSCISFSDNMDVGRRVTGDEKLLGERKVPAPAAFSIRWIAVRMTGEKNLFATELLRSTCWVARLKVPAIKFVAVICTTRWLCNQIDSFCFYPEIL